MATVEVRILKNYYKISCQDDQIDKLSRLVEQFKIKIQEIFPNVTNTPEVHIFLMTALVLLDENNELTGTNSVKNFEGSVDHLINKIEKLAFKLENI